MQQQRKKKKAAFVEKAAFKDGPDSTGLNAKHYIGVPMNLTRFTPIKPSPVALIACTNRS